MKLAWICYNEVGTPFESVEIKFSEPESYMYQRIIPIVFAEIQQ